MAQPSFVVPGFIVIVDSNEQAPFSFKNIRQGKKPVIVQTRRKHLTAGDYSIEGMEDQVTVERKSATDFFKCLGKDRDRFEMQFVKCSRVKWAAIVVETSLAAILGGKHSQETELNPWTVYHTMLAWQQRFPTVHWWLCPDRTFAEMTTFRILDRWWRDSEEGKRENAKRLIESE